MCGISAVLDYAAQPETAAALAALHAPVRHRGPDGEGFLTLARDGHFREFSEAPGPQSPACAGLAFRWLKVTDRSDAARQPMVSPDGQHALVFNGEIYNFRVLRRELQALGRVFRSQGDAEVVLAAYEAWGTDCLPRLDGMWALVLLDRRRGRLVFSRDRFGIKSLHWTIEERRLLIGSEIKQLLAARAGPARAHPRSLARFLRGNILPSVEDTYFEGVHAAPPATWCELPLRGDRMGAPEFHSFWRLSDYSCADDRAPPMPYNDAVEEVRARLTNAVVSHSVADVGVGSLLSGGLDSSLVTSLAAANARIRGREWPSFSVGMGDAGPLDELPYARSLVEQDGLSNHAAALEPDWFARNAAAAIRAMEEPPLGMAALAQYRVFELARAHGVTVVLDGQGADEVFGGYPGHQRILIRHRVLSGRILDALREMRAIASTQGRGFLPFAADYLRAGVARRVRPRLDYLDPDFGGEAGPCERAAQLDYGNDRSPLNRELYHSVRWGNIRVVLPYSDKNAMAHSIEARVPYFDRSLAELAFSLPDSYKVGGGHLKRLLRDVARQRLPRTIMERKERSGFRLAEAAWLKTVLWPTVRDSVGDSLLRSAPFRATRAERFLADFAAARHDDFRGVWRLFALGVWTEVFAVRLP